MSGGSGTTRGLWLTPVAGRSGARATRGDALRWPPLIIERDGRTRYGGAIDSDAVTLHDEARRYLDDALAALLDGAAPKPGGEPKGCVLAEGRVRRLQTARVTRDGREVSVALTVSPLIDSTGAVIGKAVIARDISEQRRAEERFRLAVEASPSAMLMVDAHDLFGLRKDGTEVPVEIGLNPIQTPEGTFVLASIVDITERRQADLKFRLAVEASPSGIAMVDDRGHIALVNAETERMFGYAKGELVGRSLDRSARAGALPRAARAPPRELQRRGALDGDRARALRAQEGRHRPAPRPRTRTTRSRSTPPGSAPGSSRSTSASSTCSAPRGSGS